MNDERVVQIEHNIEWLLKPNEGRWILTEHLPPLELVSTAMVLAFQGDRLLMTHLKKRGWDIPGGHVEAGEKPEETLRREVIEETGVELGTLHVLGYQQLLILTQPPPTYRYPFPVAYQLFYRAQVARLREFAETEETWGRGFFAPDEAAKLPWIMHHRAFYEAALDPH